MIAAANRDIRRHLRLAELRRAQITNSPFAYLDGLIADLESLHLDGYRLIPPSFAPTLFAVNRLLPDGVAPLPERRGLIRDMIDQCFDLQERLLAQGNGRLLGGDDLEDAGG
jgi:hypothetical protein